MLFLKLFQRPLQFIRHNNDKEILLLNCVRTILKLNVGSEK